MLHGAHAVGSMVTFVNGDPDKSRYRHYRIRSIDASSGGDDFGMMLEVLKRRFARGRRKKIFQISWWLTAARSARHGTSGDG